MTSIFEISSDLNYKIPVESSASNNQSLLHNEITLKENLHMSLVTAAADYIHILCIIVIAFVASIIGIVVLTIVRKQNYYYVDKYGIFVNAIFTPY